MINVAADSLARIEGRQVAKVRAHSRHIGEALEEIIIGPSQYAEVIELAFVRMLEELGIPNAAKRVSKSNIPLR